MNSEFNFRRSQNECLYDVFWWLYNLGCTIYVFMYANYPEHSSISCVFVFFFCYVEVDRYFSHTQFFISVWLSEGGKYVQRLRSRLLAKLVVFHDLWPNYPAKLEKIQIVARWLFDDVFFCKLGWTKLNLAERLFRG